MNNNKYKVDNTQCQFKELTLDEVEQVNEFWNDLKAKENELTIKTSHDKIEQLFSMILEPSEATVNEKQINFRKVTEPVAMEILKDFFLSRVKLGRIMKNSFQDSIMQQ